MKPPDIEGPHGQAWKRDLEAMTRINPRVHAGLAGWIVKAPWAHPAWHSYSIDLIHLRPLPGLPPPRIHLLGATHEIFVHALDPEWVMDLEKPAPFLQPSNYVGQFISTDRVAISRVEGCVIEIVNGNLSPDTDYMQHWIQLFGASNVKGDPARAGETIIKVTNPDGSFTEMVIDPKSLDKKPKP